MLQPRAAGAKARVVPGENKCGYAKTLKRRRSGNQQRAGTVPPQPVITVLHWLGGWVQGCLVSHDHCCLSLLLIFMRVTIMPFIFTSRKVRKWVWKYAGRQVSP